MSYKYTGRLQFFTEQGMEGHGYSFLQYKNDMYKELSRNCFQKIKKIKIFNDDDIIYDGPFIHETNRKILWENNISGFMLSASLLDPKLFSKAMYQGYSYELESDTAIATEPFMTSQIVTSLLDNDYYKFTMGQFVYFRYPKTKVSYKFILRNKDVDLSPYAKEIESEIKAMDNIRLLDYEAQWLLSSTNGVMTESYVNFLKNFKFDSKQVVVSVIDGKLDISVNGLWKDTILYEPPILSIVNEVFYRNKPYQEKQLALDIGMKNLNDTVDFLNNIDDPNFKITEMGTRRRRSRDWQDLVMRKIKDCKSIVGTSNVQLALKYDIKVLGSIAHEMNQSYQVFSKDKDKSIQNLLSDWYEFYGDKLNVALTDIIGVKAFLKEITEDQIKNKYKTFRHDSADEILWTKIMNKKFTENGINPKDKVLLYSNGLSVKKAFDVYEQVKDTNNTGFGIGTQFTNNCGDKTLSIVMKIDTVDGEGTAKISDEPSDKTSGKKEVVDFWKSKYIPMESDNE